MRLVTAFRHDEFDKVDQAASADPFIEFLARIEQVPDVVTRRQRSYELLEIVPGSVILDVGCGIGTVSADLAALGARPIGVDAAEAMIWRPAGGSCSSTRTGTAI